ncbi:MAG: dihydrofolate reductase [Chloroflexota bacterium]|nr:MAG: dihydrofolate reductase [Chloroflexota bacterium]
MLISIIAAMDEKRGIGFENRLPWNLPDDLRHFKTTTLGHHLIMGRKTYLSLGRPLPKRTNIILSQNPSYNPQTDVIIAHSLGEALLIAQNNKETEVFITGGASIYRQSLPLANRLYLTLVHTQTKADAFFPQINPHNWVEEHSTYHPADKNHAFPFTIKSLKKT